MRNGTTNILWQWLTVLLSISTPFQLSVADTSQAVTSTESARASQFNTGVTLTQYSLDSWGDAQAIDRGTQLLLQSTQIVNQHLMGFGALNPEPSPGDYRFESIDRRIGLTNGVARDANVIVLTACCAPDWMKGGDVGATDWSKIEVAPLPEHFDRYAKLVAELVRRPEFANIQYVQVWNEMKGFWDLSRNRWDHEAYTELYNKVWTRVKAVRPDIKIGGPYVVLNSFGGSSPFASNVGGSWGRFDYRDLAVLTYWLEHKIDADFVVVDTTIANRDRVNPVRDFDRTQKFSDFMAWVRELDDVQYPGVTTLPVWWAEWYAVPDNANVSDHYKNALMAVGLIRTIKSGASAALIWGPQGDINGQMFPLGLFSDTRETGGGRATLYYQTQKYIFEHFAEGRPLVELPQSNSLVETLASESHVLMVNSTDRNQSLMVDRKTIALAPFQVLLHERIVDTPLISIVDSTISEVDAEAIVSVSLSRPSQNTVDAVFFTRPDTATPGQDYFGKTQIVRFEPGKRSEIVRVKILDDAITEPTETVQLHLIKASNAEIANGRATLTINDNDSSQPNLLSIEPLTVNEDVRKAQLTVRLSEPATEVVTLRAFTQTGDATPGRDYYGRTASIEFQPGETQQVFEVTVVDDVEQEATETIPVRIAAPTGATIFDGRATLSIIDND